MHKHRRNETNERKRTATHREHPTTPHSHARTHSRNQFYFRARLFSLARRPIAQLIRIFCLRFAAEHSFPMRFIRSEPRRMNANQTLTDAVLAHFFGCCLSHTIPHLYIHRMANAYTCKRLSTAATAA